LPSFTPLMHNGSGFPELPPELVVDPEEPPDDDAPLDDVVPLEEFVPPELVDVVLPASSGTSSKLKGTPLSPPPEHAVTEARAAPAKAMTIATVRDMGPPPFG